MHSPDRSRLGLLIAAAAIACGMPIGACSEDSPPAEQGDERDCRLIANRCHYYDTVVGSPVAKECHDTGHDGVSPAACTAMKAECLAECPERDGGESGGTGGTGNTESDAASDTGGSGGSGAASGGDAGADAGEDSGSDAAGASGSGGTGASGGSAGTGATGGASGTGGSGGTGGSACDQLGTICHDVRGEFPEHCHNLGHDENEALCEAELEACLEACRDAT